jgi:hypothetical protein
MKKRGIRTLQIMIGPKHGDHLSQRITGELPLIERLNDRFARSVAL